MIKRLNKKIVGFLSVAALIVAITGFSLKDLLFNCNNNETETPHTSIDSSIKINGDNNIVGGINISIDSSKLNNSIINTGTINYNNPTDNKTK
jgi:hypothetical protein